MVKVSVTAFSPYWGYRVIVGLLSGLASWPASAAERAAQYGSRVWQTDAGLPQHFAQAVAQTRDGYLWVGTQNGLARFDGARFTVFQRTNVPEMANANIVGLHESRDGSLWIATGKGGILRLKDGKFTHYGKSDGLADDTALGSICEAGDGSLWFGMLGGLSRLKEGRFTNFGSTNGLASSIVRGICEDKHGNLWLATSGGVDCWSNGVVVRHFGVADGLKEPDARAICCDREGTVWFSSRNGLSREQDGKLTTWYEGDEQRYNIITSLYADRHGNLWVGSYGGLCRFVDGQFVPQLNPNGMQFDLVRSVREDREDNLWVASRDGLIQLRPQQFVTYTQKQGLSQNNVICVLQDQPGTVWIGTWGGGLNQYSNGVLTAYANPAPVPVLALAIHECRSSGALWVGTDFGGNMYCLEGRRITTYGKPHGLSGRAVRVIYEDRQTNLWVGTSAGLYRAAEKRFVRFGTEYGLGDFAVRAIHQDRAGVLWIGTEEGLWRFKEGIPERLTTRNGLSTNLISALYEDGGGTLWVGTGGGGLNRFRQERFVAFTTRDGLLCNSIWEILEDDHGWLWMATPQGVFSVSHAELEAMADGKIAALNGVAYAKGDGMLTDLCNGVGKPSAWKTRDGRLWFATAKGVSVIDPRTRIHEDRTPPPVKVERIIADKQPFPSEAALALASPARIPPGRGELEFQYTALSFCVPERNRFRYRLEGVVPEWVDAGARRAAYYTHLYPGRYRFQVVACNSRGDWNQAGATADVLLLPHYWETRWFKALVAGGIALVVLGIHRLRIAQVRAIERLRLRIAADLHDEVGSNLSTISLLSRKLQKSIAMPGEDKDDLSAIHRISLQASSAIREIIWFINPEYDTLQDLTLRMKEAADSALAGIDHHFQSPPDGSTTRLPLRFRQNIFLVYKETLTNVAKHSRASRVEIGLASRDHTIELSIRDNGVGFDPAAPSAGNGLKNMRLRAAAMKARLDVESRAGQGTTVRLALKIR